MDAPAVCGQATPSLQHTHRVGVAGCLHTMDSRVKRAWDDGAAMPAEWRLVPTIWAIWSIITFGLSSTDARNFSFLASEAGLNWLGGNGVCLMLRSPLNF